ncbi:ribonuclease BN [Citrobacter sedlakii]|uniref:ribonuclease BN n=1 Tax=Citrobacter TaxID=544 RepID=UPI001969D87F|nr:MULTISPECIES: ribonuclease BN [Citrobacter]MBM9567779.1 ribonuclease BN [Citrobacter sedlakii]HBL4690619.1 ribonuclease BN [Citrobacter sedlakii]HBL4705529.1 ribonuclease BN [Citrobacter sedlakii]HBL4719807.1 ribonuclease BN [Citrobacter sedlakii]HCA7840758.1 ribonuclease BN [Citrobacter sedlakii]
MEFIFLGTSAGVPTRARNVTAILLHLHHPTQPALWLFDCGEGTQQQMLETAFHPGKIERIFISHLHGDHLFGLPGLLCSRSMAGNPHPLTLYGPKGLREFTETSLRLSGSWTDYPLDIVEITAGEILDDGLRKVTAYPLEHPLECYGYRVEEHDKPGALDANALKAAGVTPGPWFQDLKAGKTITLDDGRTINGADYLAPATTGKAVAIFGDTAPCIGALALAKGVDVMIHETTLDASMEEKANSRGHSSTRQAAMLAKEAGVGKLIMTHISSRYDETGCQRLLAECRAIFPHTELAGDFAVFTV